MLSFWKIVLRRSLYVLGIITFTSVYGTMTQIPDHDIELMYAKACLESPFVQRLHEQGQARFKQEAEDLQTLRISSLTVISDLKEKGDDLKNLPEQVKSKLLAWREANSQFEKGLEAYKTQASFQLKTEKMSLHIDNALRLITGETADVISSEAVARWDLLSPFITESLTEGYAFDVPQINISGNRVYSYASGRGGAMKVLTLSIQAVLQRLDKMQDVIEGVYGSEWIQKQSTFVHPTPLPESIDWTALRDNPLVDRSGRLLVIHNGYAFGGHREENHPVSFEKPWWCFPDDCSSFVANAGKCKQPFSTSHQVAVGNMYHFTHQDFGNFKMHPRVIDLWGDGKGAYADKYRNDIKQDPYLEPTVDFYESFFSTDCDPSTIPAGSIWTRRTYPSFDGLDQYTADTLTGSGGHTAVLLGVWGGQGPEQYALTLGSNREIRNVLLEDAQFGGIDGNFLVQPFPARSGKQANGDQRVVYYGKPRIEALQ